MDSLLSAGREGQRVDRQRQRGGSPVAESGVRSPRQGPCAQQPDIKHLSASPPLAPRLPEGDSRHGQGTDASPTGCPEGGTDGRGNGVAATLGTEDFQATLPPAPGLSPRPLLHPRRLPLPRGRAPWHSVVCLLRAQPAPGRSGSWGYRRPVHRPRGPGGRPWCLPAATGCSRTRRRCGAASAGIETEPMLPSQRPPPPEDDQTARWCVIHGTNAPPP